QRDTFDTVLGLDEEDGGVGVGNIGTGVAKKRCRDRHRGELQLAETDTRERSRGRLSTGRSGRSLERRHQSRFPPIFRAIIARAALLSWLRWAGGAEQLSPSQGRRSAVGCQERCDGWMLFVACQQRGGRFRSCAGRWSLGVDLLVSLNRLSGPAS